jgi:hypothetical protein
VVEEPGIAHALAAGALAVQIGSPLYLVHRRLRMVWGALLLGFHINVQLLTGIGYGAPMLLLLVWSYPWGRAVARLRGSAPPPAEDPPLLPDAGPAGRRRFHRATAAAFAVAAALAAAAWILPIARWTTWHGVPAEEGPMRRTVAQLGPLTAGEALVEGWRLVSIEIAPDAIVLRVARSDGGAAATLWLKPSPAGVDRGPFGAGSADLLYDEDARLSPEAMAPAGREIARRLREAAGGGDTGRLVTEWLAGAPGGR